jgi:uncharacterized protein (TIGR02270 family)
MRAITEQHAEQAAFLWTRRERLAVASHVGLRELRELDERVEAHLDGVRLAGREGVGAARALLDGGEPGAAFLCAERALAAKDPKSFAELLDRASEQPGLEPELGAALAWVSAEAGRWAVRALLHQGCPPFLWRLGLGAKVAHREDPGEPLVLALWGDDPELRRVGLGALGVLGRRDLLNLAQEDYGQARAEVRAAAAISGALLGDPAARGVLWEVGASVAEAHELALRAAPAPRGHLEALAASSPREAIVAIETSLDPSKLPWLVEWMRAPELARLAARAIRVLTGLRVEGPLRGAAPEGFTSGPTDDPTDPDVAPDPDASLPWPHVARLEAATRARLGSSARLGGGRALWGRPVSPETCELVLRHGTQHERHAAALELALLSPGAPLRAVDAPGYRQ